MRRLVLLPVMMITLLPAGTLAADDPAARHAAWEQEDRVLDGNPVRRFSHHHPRVRFSGDWAFSIRGNPYGPPALRTDRPDDYVELEFVGSAVAVFTKCGNIRGADVLTEEAEKIFGWAEVLIDGKPATQITGEIHCTEHEGRALLDTSQGDPNTGWAIVARNLPMGRHTIRLTLSDHIERPDRQTTMSVMAMDISAQADREADPWQARACRYAMAVRGSAVWQDRAAKLLANIHDEESFKQLKQLYYTSREIDEVATRLRSIYDRPQPSARAMAELERASWTPAPETRQYYERLSQIKHRADQLLATIDQFDFETSGRTEIDDLLQQMRQVADQRDALLAGEIRGLPPIVFFTRYHLNPVGAAANYIWQSQPNKWGCSIRVYDPATPDVPPKTIFEETDGSIFDMNLSFDAKTVFFSYRKRAERYWHLWEIGVDGKNPRRITEGDHFNVSPVPLPDGRLACISSRTRGSHTVCQDGPSTHVYVMNRDGSDARDLSGNTLSDFGLSLLPDGRLLYTRWEYIDADLGHRQSLWTENIDGTRVQLFFGNTIVHPRTFWQARAIPGRAAVVCTFAPHHGTPHGAIGVVRKGHGLESERGVGYRWITREFPIIGDVSYFWSYRDPYPVSEHQFLVSYGGEGKNRFRIYLLDDLDNKVQVVEDVAMGCYGAMPLRPRERPHLQPEAMIAEKLDPDRFVRKLSDGPPGTTSGNLSVDDVPKGVFLLADVYQGLEPTIERGRVKYLRIMEQLPKTVNTSWDRAYFQGPLLSLGTYYAKRCWGYVPVEEDGSAHFMAPAGREIYFQACDAQGKELLRMTSATVIMPGEVQSCIGCHEHRAMAPPSRGTPLASKRPPSPLKLPDWGNNGVLDYNKLVQPVWDKYCIECHGASNPDAGLSLVGDRTRLFNISYDHLIVRSQSNQISTVWQLGDHRERPMVQFNDMYPGRFEAPEPLSTGSHVSRLLDYVDTDHCEQMIPLKDRQRIYVWIDAMLPYYATSDNARPVSHGGRDAWAKSGSKQLDDWFTGGFEPVYNRRCAECHGPMPHNPHGHEWTAKYAWLNLSRPELSLALSAHLAKEAGGQGLTENDFGRLLNDRWVDRKSYFEQRWHSINNHYRAMEKALAAGKKVPRFTDRSDPDYVTMLEAIRRGKELLEANPRADMPGFVNRSAHTAFGAK